MFTGICDCGSDQFQYIGVDDVEGNAIIEIFRCAECGTDYEKRTYIPDADDESDIDPIDRIDYDPRPYGER